jgi:hypothetical protein
MSYTWSARRCARWTAALSVAAPEVRMTKKSLHGAVPVLRQAAEMLAGHFGPPGRIAKESRLAKARHTA